MAKWNEVKFEGNLGKDPEQKGSVTLFSIAVWQGKDKPTLWLACKSFDVPISARKGEKVAVAGRLYFDTWRAQDNTERSSYGVIVESCQKIEREATSHVGVPRAIDDDCPF